MRNAAKWLIAPALVLAFVAVVVWIVMTPLQMGDAYPPYSTLRVDPQGAKVLFDSLAELPGLRVERNFKRLFSIRGTQPGTLFFLGGSGPAIGAVSEPELREWEGLAAEGWRLVFVFNNALPRMDANFDAFVNEAPAADKKRELPMHERWGMRFRLRKASVEERAKIDRAPRTSALYFEGDPTWRVLNRERDGFASHVEKAIGKGSVTFAARIFPISNEGLREHQDGKFVSELVGGNKRVVFDELHHGLDETGSVGSLIRRYRMQGVVGVLMLLGILFIWRNSTGLLPFKDPGIEAGEVLGRDNKQGMLTLLRRNVPRASVLDVCLAEWERARPLMPAMQARRTPRAPSPKEGLATGYRNIYQQLQERK